MREKKKKEKRQRERKGKKKKKGGWGGGGKEGVSRDFCARPGKEAVETQQQRSES